MTTGIESILEIKPEDGEPVFDIREFNFRTTDELSPLEEIVGQPRAMHALELGLGIRNRCYNIYMAGMSGMGKKAMVKNILAKKIINEPVAADWIYVNNFDQEDRPLAISLQAGQGARLKRDMKIFLDRLQDNLPRAFRQEDFSREKQRLEQIYEQRGREAFERLEKLAVEHGLIVQETPDGRIIMVPKKGDHPMNATEFDKLTENEKTAINRNQQVVGQTANAVLSEQQEIGRQLRADVRQIEKIFAGKIIDPAINELCERYRNDKLNRWLDRLRTDLIDNLNKFHEKDYSPNQQALSVFGMPAQTADEFAVYQINLVVDNGASQGAPVIVEESPNYKNLFGTIPGIVDRMGKLFTNYSHIKAGSLLRANGGYLIFDIMEALTEPLVWKELKRTIKSGFLEYHMYDPFGVFATSTIRPEPIPLNVKLIVIGNPLVYHLLQLYDEDFPEIFKVKADFSPEIDRTPDMSAALGQLVRKLKDNGVLPFDSDAVLGLVRLAARLAGDKHKITAEFSRLVEVATEASFWAQKDNSSIVTNVYIQRAIDEKIYRSDLIAEKIKEYVKDGTLLISVEGEVVGQVNALSIIQLGDYTFGRPIRLTASVGVGTAGIINIERESRLSGNSFDKAMLILEGYLRNKYAQQHPPALSASITMEQSYGTIEGDSATLAELVCLLSAFARLPLRQDIAVTGSVNQWGQVQAIGGVIEKIEGFFDICKLLGFNGKQGVCIPDRNVKNLVLRPDVIDAMRKSNFHIWAVRNIDEAIELLSGITAGDLEKQGTFHWQVDHRLMEMMEIIKEQKTGSLERAFPSYRISPDRSDPRPRLPDEEK